MAKFDPSCISDRDRYFFDLRGFLLLKGALSKDEVKDCNDTLDALPALERGQWYGHIHGHAYAGSEGLNLQQIYEAGPAFENLIDHPSWIDKVQYFVGGYNGFDYNHGPLFIDENSANFRGPDEGIGLHSGGDYGTKRTQFRYYNGEFHCGQVNILMAFTDIGPGDGATVVVPGSHKQHFKHPDLMNMRMRDGTAPRAQDTEGAVEVYMEAGDAILFVDGLCHGSACRENEGFRRICVYRYGPSWGRFRHAYEPSQELLARLTPERRKIVHPQDLLPRDNQVQLTEDTPRIGDVKPYTPGSQTGKFSMDMPETATV